MRIWWIRIGLNVGDSEIGFRNLSFNRIYKFRIERDWDLIGNDDLERMHEGEWFILDIKIWYR